MPKGDANGPAHAASIKRGKILTDLLRRELDKVHDETDENGDPITKAQAIIQSIVRDATGYTEKTRDDAGTLKEIKHPAVAWAKQWIVDRIEGKAVPTTGEAEAGIRAADKVRELSRDRVNALTKATAKKGPPVHRPKV